jgi:predicted short-subunit dehydrogenase-like oxidoreductase (DUF2520 family)
MSAQRSAKPHVAIVGAGNLAWALGVALHKAGYEIERIVARENASSMRKARRLAREVGASAAAVSRAEISAEVAWFCVPDAAIAGAAASLAKATQWKGKIALHSSGALTSQELAVLRKRGAALASVHPLMTFVSDSRPSLENVPFAIEGDPRALRIARAIVLDLGGKPFAVKPSQKSAYHTWGMFVSPLLTTLLAASEEVAGLAGVGRKVARERMLPILRQTLANYERLGAPRSFSGPIIRGDIETIKKHLDVLSEIPEARRAYVALARVALRKLPTKNRAGLEKILRP